MDRKSVINFLLKLLLETFLSARTQKVTLEVRLDTNIRLYVKFTFTFCLTLTKTETFK